MEGFMLRQITLLHEFVNEYRKGVIGLNRLIERIESIRAVIDPPALKDELANVAMLLEEINAYVIETSAPLTGILLLFVFRRIFICFSSFFLKIAIKAAKLAFVWPIIR